MRTAGYRCLTVCRVPDDFAGNVKEKRKDTTADKESGRDGGKYARREPGGLRI